MLFSFSSAPIPYPRRVFKTGTKNPKQEHKPYTKTITSFLEYPFLVHLGLEESNLMLKFYWRVPRETYMVMIKRCVWNNAFLLGAAFLLNPTEAIYIKEKEKIPPVL